MHAQGFTFEQTSRLHANLAPLCYVDFPLVGHILLEQVRAFPQCCKWTGVVYVIQSMQCFQDGQNDSRVM